MSIQANQGGGVTIFSAGGTGGGGGGTPGGSSGQLQYNASGSFGGMSGTSWNDTTRSLALTGATVTTSSPVFDLTQTWNAGATTFTAIKMNVTDTASASGSLLLDLQVGGSSRFNIDKGGSATASLLFSAQYMNASVALQLTANAGVINIGVSADLILGRNAAASLRLGAADAAAPVAQTLGVQSVVAGTSNTAGTNFTIRGSAGTGTGAGGSLIFQVAPAGSSGTAQNAFATALELLSTRSAVLGGSAFYLGGVTSGAYISSVAATQLDLYSNNTATVRLQGGYLYVRNGIGINGGSPAVGADVMLERDAANTLALRNGTSAQTFNVYETYTDASNYSRLAFQYNSGAGSYDIGPQALGTGSVRPLRFITANQNIYFLTSSTPRLFIDYNGHLGAGTIGSGDNTYDWGKTVYGDNRPRHLYVGTSITPGAGVAVASLPTPSTGMVARVTNALAPAIGSTVAGGGAANALVWYNGTNWTVIGV